MRLPSALLTSLCLCFAACSPPLDEGPDTASHGRYLVRLRTPAPGELTPSVQDQALELTSRYGGTLVHVYESLRGFAVADLPEERAQALSFDPAVAGIERDSQIRVAGEAAAGQ